MRYEVLKADQLNGNGHLYPIDLVQKIADKINQGDVFVLSDAPFQPIEIDRVIGYAQDAELEDGLLSAEIKVLDTPCGMIYKELLKARARLNLTVSGTGMLKSDGTVTDYQLISLYTHNGNNA